MASRPRVIIASPDPIECQTLADWLTAEHFEPVRRSSPRAARDEIHTRPFDLLIADADFAFRDGLHAASRARRPLTPTVVVGAAEADRSDSTSQAMYLPRPVERAMVVCTASMAILDGRPVRCSERRPVNRFAAVVNGVPSYIVDVSNEGLRLETPPDRRSVPPPLFNVRVPLFGVAVTVRRMWAKPRTAGRTDVTWYGGALWQNQAGAARNWRVFVDTISDASGPSSDSLQVRD